jgi:PIN domain nuclease of toxin-antitoxin system
MPKRLGKAALRFLRDVDRGRAEILVPAIVAVELSLVREAGRKVIGPVQLGAILSAQPAFRLLPLDLQQAIEFALLDGVGDPFVRMLLAAARATAVPLITADMRLHEAAVVETIWD